MARVSGWWDRYHLAVEATALLVGLYLSSRYSYLLFHTVAEGFSIVVATSTFLFAWNSRRFLKTDLFLFIGIAYLAAAALDFLHTLAYKGMGVFPGHSADLPTQFWLAARFVQSGALLISPIFLQRRISAPLTLALFGLITALWTGLIFAGQLPTAYVEGEGLTTFKIASEYLIMLILLLAAGAHYRMRAAFAPQTFALLFGSILITVVAELAFTLYTGVYGLVNVLGHFLKIIAYFLIYKAVLQTGLVNPFDLLFSNLERAEERYRAYFKNTPNGLAIFEIEREGHALDYALIEANPSLARLAGVQPDRDIGERLGDLPLPLDYADLLEMFRKVQTQRQPVRQELPSTDGSRTLRLSIFESGHDQIAMILEDVTERKRSETVLQESEARLRTVLENMPVLLFATDGAGRIIAWNRECERVSGYGQAEVLGTPDALVMLIPDKASRQRLATREPARQEPYRDQEAVLACKDGSQRHIAWSSVAEQYPVPGWANWVVGVDITQRKLIEALEREQRQLAEALRDIANALNSALSLSQVLDRVLANVEQVIPHDIAKILLIDPETGAARAVGSRTTDPAVQDGLADLSLPVDTTPHLLAMKLSRQPLIVDDIQTETMMRLTYDVYWRAYLGAPILLENQVIGFIGLGSWQPGFFNESHAARLEAFAGQVAIAIHNARLLERERSVIAAQERERLARDLHDAVSQTLFSASMIAEALPRQWQRNPEKALAQLAELHQLTRGAMAEMRVLLLELRPTSLLEVDLPVLLRQLAEAIRSRKRMAISVDIDGEFPFEPDTKLALYRITQEALNNIAKHSRATKASVQLRRCEEGVELAIEDNGAGFDLDGVQPTSLGLNIMRERSDEIGAELTITTRQGEGTRLHLFLPRQEQREAARSS
ncbi:MAG: PAS domain S-box protein [Anaerolineae bacterium]|nr:PAS domain S-box protein [Anaerolineae bacterium]